MKNKRGYTDSDMEEMGFDSEAYEFPEGEKELCATLVMKKWTNKMGIICYFDTDDGNHYKLIAYLGRASKGKYTAKDYDIDMSYEPLGARFKIRYSSLEKHYTVWKSCVRCE